MARGPGRLGPGRRAHRAAARRGRVRDLHARQRRGPPDLDRPVVRRAAGRPSWTIPSCCRDRVATAATSLLTLVGVDADPLRSREHILVSTLFDRSRGRRDAISTCRRSSRSPDAADRPRSACSTWNPSIPAKDRFALAMQLNNLLAAPGFAAWLQGEPLDVGRAALHAEGKPRVSDHLDRPPRRPGADVLRLAAAERDGRLDARAARHRRACGRCSTWTRSSASCRRSPTRRRRRRCSRCSSRPAPSAWASSLATQNPVDLDYKALSNAGTWFLGRLQTERDKARVLDGLEARPAQPGDGFDRARLDQLLSSLGKRIFLLHNVHEKRAGAVRDPLGDVVPARAAGARRDQAVECGNWRWSGGAPGAGAWRSLSDLARSGCRCRASVRLSGRLRGNGDRLRLSGARRARVAIAGDRSVDPAILRARRRRRRARAVAAGRRRASLRRRQARHRRDARCRGGDADCATAPWRWTGITPSRPTSK